MRNTLIACIEHGLPVLVEGVTDTIDAIFEPLLSLRPLSKRPKNNMLRIAEGITPIPILKAPRAAPRATDPTPRPQTTISEGEEIVEMVATTEEVKSAEPMGEGEHMVCVPPLKLINRAFSLVNLLINVHSICFIPLHLSSFILHVRISFQVFFAGEARPCHEDFRMYFTTRYDHSKLTTAMAAKVSVVNFALTPKSLVHQMVPESIYFFNLCLILTLLLTVV